MDESDEDPDIMEEAPEEKKEHSDKVLLFCRLSDCWLTDVETSDFLR